MDINRNLLAEKQRDLHMKYHNKSASKESVSASVSVEGKKTSKKKSQVPEYKGGCAAPHESCEGINDTETEGGKHDGKGDAKTTGVPVMGKVYNTFGGSSNGPRELVRSGDGDSLGKGQVGAKRHHKVFKNQIDGITKPIIRRLSRRVCLFSSE
jgi:hypothetical protein